MDKRLPIAIVVSLAQPQEKSVNGYEITYTDNISAHGARVISGHFRNPGEVLDVTCLKDQVPFRGKVIYCHKLEDDRYGVGVYFLGRNVTWSKFLTYSGN
jgi:hypothetical protein